MESDEQIRLLESPDMFGEAEMDDWDVQWPNAQASPVEAVDEATTSRKQRGGENDGQLSEYVNLGVQQREHVGVQSVEDYIPTHTIIR